ncbi:MAG: MraY family glycosyltransferase [Candidatus Acidiferrales bacterium]|jgi:UDP-GlcNAc:undecaprenyl-phosphate GlcNAc-1-phosphate transferase
MDFILVFATSLILSAFLSRLVRDVANGRGWAAAPETARHIHKNPTPQLGGIAILTSVIVVVAVATLLSRVLGFRFGLPISAYLGILGPTLLIFALGLVDDFRPLGPYWKFGIQVLAAGWLFLDGYRVSRFHLIFGEHALGSFISLVFTIFWVLLITNAFNLLDGLDGLAAGSALFSSLVVFVISLASGNTFSQVITLSLAGAIVGFLRYNFNPATIFLGDCGSLVIGFLLASISLVSSHKASTAVAVGIPVVSFGLPILDTMLSVLRRFLNGKPLFSGDGEHIHHVLLRRGLSHRKVVVVLYAVSAGFALVSLLMLYPQAISVALVIVGIGIFFGLQHLGYHEVTELEQLARRYLRQRAIISNNLAIRRASEELSVAHNLHDICRILQTAFQQNDYDGFEFSFTPKRFGPSATQSVRPPLEFEWRKESSEHGKGWVLSMDLVAGEGRGFLSVFRSYARRLLRSDVDCITTELVPSLSGALERSAQNRESSGAFADETAEPTLTLREPGQKYA